MGLISLVDLCRRQVPGAGYRAVKIVRVGSAVGGNIPSGLCPGYGVGTVGVYDAPQSGEGIVERQMGSGVRGGIQAALHLPALQIQHHQVLRAQCVILHPGGLDDKQSPLPVNAADIAPGVGHQPPPWQFHIGLVDLLFQFLQHIGKPPVMVFPHRVCRCSSSGQHCRGWSGLHFRSTGADPLHQ